MIQGPRYGLTEQERYWIQCLQNQSYNRKPWILSVDCSEESLLTQWVAELSVPVMTTRKRFVVTWFITWPFSGCSHMLRACRDRVYGQPGGHLEVLRRWSNGCTEVHRWVARTTLVQTAYPWGYLHFSCRVVHELFCAPGQPCSLTCCAPS